MKLDNLRFREIIDTIVDNVWFLSRFSSSDEKKVLEEDLK